MKPSPYQVPAFETLSREAANPRDLPVQLRQIERAEALAAKLDPKESYSVVDIVSQVTGSDDMPRNDDKSITGEVAASDLRRLVEDLSTSIDMAVDNVGEPVLTVDDVSRRFNVSTKTVDRWRDRGLVSRRLRFGDRQRVAFLQSSVERFAKHHPQEVDRGRRFTQLSDRERDEIIDAARQLARTGGCPAEVSRRLSQRFERSPETIRYTIKNHDDQHPGQAVFGRALAKLTDDQKDEIARKHQRGVSVDRLARQYCRTKSSIYRVVSELRARKLLSEPIDFMDSPEFHKKNAEKVILTDPPVVEGKARTARAPSGLPPYLASLYAIPLLNKEQEQYYFRKMNYLKFRAAKLQAQLDPSRPKTTDMDQIESMMADAVEVKNLLIRSNLRLVVSIAKKKVSLAHNFFEMVSDGNISLIRAIEKFDYTKGNKFSTYATWAIVKNFSRSIPAEHKRLDRFRTGIEDVFQGSSDDRSSQFHEEMINAQQHNMLMDILGHLDDREKDIIVFRYGLEEGEEPLTLEQVGSRFGVTKERIRQLESRALKKLRKIAQDEKLDIPELMN
ncbi:sigma-70 family RNA polymerase sigma factor [Calycomorphotria hydatis]|uniref:RNA polymerase sigma factor SigB n=1 Tax=Calycomorphotria hydatis TaxID=2528027 RepID=A0A517T8C4_9PLAN|nr:sigma-70 family RNA polymerase sigma factor [Calycomorphotria hydatis]QDT64624.1 RNA polymerase sigma factor SigB [Calycomorphotria hydatis]